MMNDLTEKLQTLSSAEDFLAFFGVPHEPSVVNVSRLHILKRFYQYIRQTPGLPEDNEQALYGLYRDLLVKAYQDFVTSTPAPATAPQSAPCIRVTPSAFQSR